MTRVKNTRKIQENRGNQRKIGNMLQIKNKTNMHDT